MTIKSIKLQYGYHGNTYQLVLYCSCSLYTCSLPNMLLYVSGKSLVPTYMYATINTYDSAKTHTDA